MALQPEPGCSARSITCPKIPAHIPVPVCPWSPGKEPEPLAEHAELPSGCAMLELLMEAERKDGSCSESYLRWDNLHFCLLWCLLSHPRDIREMVQGHRRMLSYP